MNIRNRINVLSRFFFTVWVKLTICNLFYGKKIIIDPKTRIINKGVISLGDNVYLRSFSYGYQAAMPFPTTLLIDVKGAKIKIGNRCRINGAYIHAQKSIHIGDDCLIAAGVNIIDSDGHLVNSLERSKGRDRPIEIKIGNNVWIGINSIILKGTIIGDNSVIGAGAIVKGNFPSDSLILGNPARVVKKINFTNDSNT